MNSLRIYLFGKFEVRQDDQVRTSAWTRRAQELLCYLVLFREKPHPREVLVDTLWSDYSPNNSRKQLRQVLWEMQTALHTERSNSELLVLAEADWISLNPTFSAWFDVDEFERARERAKRRPGVMLDDESARSLQRAIELYRGDLLEGWYQEWCLYERERFQNMYLDMLDSLMAYSEAQQHYEAGLEYGAKILRYDRARERTHWRLMRLYYLVNDRAGALRQYRQCVTALEQELGVKPSHRTVVLYEQIRADDVPDLFVTPISNSQPIQPLPLVHLRERLKSLRATLDEVQHQIDHEIQALDKTMGD